MLGFILKRLAVTALVIAVISVVAFSLVHLSGDPAAAMAGEGATQADVAAVRVTYGFDRPLYAQYGSWLYRVVHGDFGRSYYLRERVSDVLEQHFPVTAKLGV
ncbi:MAG: ABC transporter permease, partial [Bryobacteraceae bacterium]